MNKLSLLLALFLLPLALAAACGDDEEMLGSSVTCSTDADCSEMNPVCDTRISQCVSGCNEPTDCGGTLPVCNDPATNDLPQVCVCDATSCPTGQSCLDDGTCGTPSACPIAGEISQPPCMTGEVCMPDGTCETACDDQVTCLPNQQLCSVTSTLSADFNECVAPTSLTGMCDDAMGATRDPNGPIITDVRFIRNFMDPACIGMPGEPQPLVQEFVAVAYVYSDMGLPSRLFQEGVRLLSNGTQRNTFGPPMATETGTTPVDNFEVTFTLCLSTARMMQGLAIQINDAEGNSSNPFCFFGQ